MITTAYTDKILALAAKANMVASPLDPTPGAVRLYLNGPYPHSPFGVLVIGARSGKVLRGWIKLGNEGTKTRYAGAAEIRSALRKLTR